MKRLALIILMLDIAAISYAQNGCSKSSPIFKEESGMAATEVSKFGRNPQFPFLRNLSSAEQVASAIKKANKDNKRGISQLNDMLTDIGFANGAKDITASNITAQYLPNGTIGNMGDGNMGTSYTKIMTKDGRGVKAWKIAANSSCALYIIAPCGNAFYEIKSMACLSVPVTVSGGANDLVLEGGGIKRTTDRTYIYYQRKKYKAYEKSYVNPAIKDANPSMPLLLSTKVKSEPVISKYTVTIAPQSKNIEACPNSEPIELATSLNVEKQSEYAGYGADNNNATYKKVTKREYKKAMKKLSKAQDKERKVERITGVAVNHGRN
jgi:hypothetical protein